MVSSYKSLKTYFKLMNTKKLDKKFYEKFNMTDLYRNEFYFIKNCTFFKEATYLSDLSRKLCSQSITS